MKISKPIALTLVLVFLTASCIIMTEPASGDSAAGNTWSEKSPMLTARSALGVGVVNDKIYAIGGSTVQTMETSYISGEITGITEEYTPSTDKWITKATMPTARAYFATAVYQNKIYCFGGYTSFSHISGATENLTGINEVYYPLIDRWTTLSPMPVAAANLEANVVNGKIYLFCKGTNFGVNQIYDPQTDSWATMGPIPEASFLIGSTVVNGKIYTLVGYNGNHFNSRMEIYDPTTGNWSFGVLGSISVLSILTATTGAMAPKRIYALSGWATMATYPDGTGSQPMGEPENSTQIYDPKNDAWTLGTPKHSESEFFGVGVVNDRLYVIGGIIERYPITFGWNLYNDSPTAKNEVYTPAGYGKPDETYLLETVPPKIEILSPVNQTYNNSSVPLLLTVDKPINATAYSLDGQANITFSGNSTLTDVPNGLHSLVVYAQDTFGNVGASEVMFQVNVSNASSFPTIIVASISAALIVAISLAILYRRKKASNAPDNGPANTGQKVLELSGKIS